MNDQPRPVWITEADLAMPLDSAFREIVRAKFKAAPADATEAVGDVFERMGIPNYRMDVLRALGYP